MGYTIPGLEISSTKDILSKDTRLAMLIWARSGMGKTKLAGSLHKLTMKYLGKPTLYIAVEAGEGGGAVTIRDMDIPLWVPKDLNEINKGLAALRNDKQFGGVVLDSSSEMVKQFVTPTALKYPCRENPATRSAGIPTRSDYQVMGELTRQVFQQLMNMSAMKDPEYKKHIVVTAREKFSTDDTGKITFWGPDLPGAIAGDASGMFQVSTSIEIKEKVVNGTRSSIRNLVTFTNGPKSLKDRFRVFPSEIQLRSDNEDTVGMDLADMWERYWVPVMNGGNGNV